MQYSAYVYHCMFLSHAVPIPGNPTVGQTTCTLRFCEVCSSSSEGACEQCESGYTVGLDNLCVLGTGRDVDLTDTEIIGEDLWLELMVKVN